MSTSPANETAASTMLPSPSTVTADTKEHRGLHEDAEEQPRRRELPDVSHAMDEGAEDVNVEHRKEEEAPSPLHPSHPSHPSNLPHPSRPIPTWWDKLEGSFTETYAQWWSGDRQQEEAGRMLREYGREALEEALRHGDAGVQG